LITAFLFLLFGCKLHSAPAVSFFPDSSAVAGWTKAPEVRTFTPDQLSNYIDGDAEKYVKAGVRSTSTVDYKFKDRVQVVVDVYTMSTPEGAKTIFDSEPAMDAQSPSLGDAARLYSQSLIFRKGPYLVRMVAYQESPELPQAMFNLGLAMEKKLSRQEGMPMKNGSDKTRRDFLKECALGALVAGTAPFTFAADGKVNPAGAAEAKSKVVIARDPSLYATSSSPDTARVQKLLDQAIQNFFESSDPVSPWQKLVHPGEVVGLKVNTIAGPGLSTHVVLVEAICERLKQAGVKPNNIIVWDRTNEELERAGYTLSRDPNRVRILGTDSKDVGYDENILAFGVVESRLSNLLTRTCDCMINVPILKHHSGSGVTLAMKNMYGVNNNPDTLHDNNCCPGVADLNMLPPIRNKFRFVVADAMTSCFEAGPGFKPQYAWKYNGLMVASDPVAIDYTGWQIIERKRAERGLKSLSQAGIPPNYIAVAADPLHNLGTDDPGRIALAEV